MSILFGAVLVVAFVAVYVAGSIISLFTYQCNYNGCEYPEIIKNMSDNTTVQDFLYRVSFMLIVLSGPMYYISEVVNYKLSNR